jgi:hypothetical protein
MNMKGGTGGTYPASSYISAGIDTYSLLSFTVQFVSAAFAWELMKPMDSVAFRAIKAVMSYSTTLVPLQKNHIPRSRRTHKLHHSPNTRPRLLLKPRNSLAPQQPALLSRIPVKLNGAILRRVAALGQDAERL